MKQVHTVLCPILTAYVDALEGRKIEHAREMVSELEAVLSPFHADLLLHSIRQNMK